MVRVVDADLRAHAEHRIGGVGDVPRGEHEVSGQEVAGGQLDTRLVRDATRRWSGDDQSDAVVVEASHLTFR